MVEQNLIPLERIERTILIVRGQKVILDSELAALYGVTVIRLNEQVSRNERRFPPDFAFRLSREEYEPLRSQFAILKKRRGEHRKYLPRVFTEHGAIMAASVLNSFRAVEMSLLVVRAFVHLRNLLSTHKELAAKLNELERGVRSHDVQIRGLVVAIRDLMALPKKPRRPIGF